VPRFAAKVTADNGETRLVPCDKCNGTALRPRPTFCSGWSDTWRSARPATGSERWRNRPSHAEAGTTPGRAPRATARNQPLRGSTREGATPARIAATRDRARLPFSSLPRCPGRRTWAYQQPVRASHSEAGTEAPATTSSRSRPSGHRDREGAIPGWPLPAEARCESRHRSGSVHARCLEGRSKSKVIAVKTARPETEERGEAVARAPVPIRGVATRAACPPGFPRF
jgi:hypothetical protein